MNGKLKFLLAQLSCCGKHLVSPRADANIFSEVGPANDAGRIYQEFRRTRDIAARRAATWVQEIVTANHFGVGIGEDGKGISGFSGKVPRNFGRVYADGHRTNARCCKLLQVLLDAS